MKSPFFLVIFYMAFAYLMTACSTIAPNARVDVQTRNRTLSELSEVAVWFGSAVCTSGYLVPNAQKTHMFYPNPITAKARVEWKNESGQQQVREVDLSDVYQSGQAGLLQIEISESGVAASLLPLPVLKK